MTLSSRLGIFFAVVACFLALPSNGADVVGCGGFVKVSDALKGLMKEKVDYSAIQVKLFTSEGLLKHSTECAPNGYYFIPIYDQGTFSLRIQGPEGWSFEKDEYEVVVPSSSGICSGDEDVNFYFTGFRIQGQVIGDKTCGGAGGVAGVTITASNGDVTLKASSGPEGWYYFDNVFPGEYTLSASHPEWTLVSNSLSVHLRWGNAVASPFVVSGFTLSGSVVEEVGGDPLAGVEVHLLSPTVKGYKCPFPASAAPPAGKKPLCTVTTGSDGAFRFQGVPCGKYTVVPLYRSEATEFDVRPRDAAVEVTRDSVSVTKPFQVVGFTVSGRVVDSKDHGVGGAKVFLDGEEKATTGANGVYTIDHVKAGTYRVEAKKEKFVIDTLPSLRISPSSPKLPDLKVSGYHVCGRVSVTDHASAPSRFAVLLKPADGVLSSAPELKRATTDSDGRYCMEVAGGMSYRVVVSLSASERASGLLLTPAVRTIKVEDAPLEDVSFFQARVKVSGAVKTIEGGALDAVTVTLAPVDPSSGATPRQSTSLKKQGGGGSYEFIDVLPGNYKVSINQENWCWEEKSIDLNVEGEDLTDVSFVQKGYLLTSVSSHAVTLFFNLETGTEDGEKKTSFPFTKGTNRFCLLKPGTYNLTPSSCFKFEKEMYKYSTAKPAPVQLSATHVSVTGTLEVNSKVSGSISVGVYAPASNGQTEISSVVQAVKTGEAKDGVTVYTYSYWAPLPTSSPREVTVTPSHDDLLFYPRAATVSFTAEECPEPATAFVSRAGLYFEGSVTPAVEGVKVTVSAPNGEVFRTVKTDKKGKYRAGPLYDDVKYTVSAEKDGYHVEKGEKDGAFTILKLGTVSVAARDSAGKPIEGVLVSLSAEGYRSNEPTLADGTVQFKSLRPGSYHLRALLKEYELDPAAQSFELGQGETKKVTLSAKRVAYSVYGRVYSLNGAPEANVAVEAVGKENHESTQSDAEGNFRIRGLKPGQEYIVRVVKGESVERASPSEVSISMTAADVHDKMSFLVFRHGNRVDISGRLDVDDLWLPDVRMGLFAASNPGVPLQEVSVGPAHHFDFFLVPRDDYYLQATTSLSKRLYTFDAPAVEVGANAPARSFHVLSFAASLRAEGSDISNAPFYALSILVVALYALTQRKTLTAFGKWYSSGRRSEGGPSGFEVEVKSTSRRGGGASKRK